MAERKEPEPSNQFATTERHKKVSNKSVLNYRLLTPMALGLIGGLLISARTVDAQSRWNTPALEQAEEATAKWDCKRGWDIAWPLAKGGDDQARLFLLSTMITNTNPPGFSSALDWSRHALVLSAYGALARVPDGKGDPNHKWIRDDIPKYISSMALGSKGSRVAKCYERGSSFRECLNLAVSMEVIPKFEDYAREVDDAVQKTGKGAVCRLPH